MNPVAQELYERIKSQGSVSGQVVKVDQFLNHMVDPNLMDLLGEELCHRFESHAVDKVITAESSGITIAYAVARKLGRPFVYAKKKKPITMKSFFEASSFSYTKQEKTTLYVSKEVLLSGERLLFVDDFLAFGATRDAISKIVSEAKAKLVGSGVIINKSSSRDIESILTLEQIVN